MLSTQCPPVLLSGPWQLWGPRCYQTARRSPHLCPGDLPLSIRPGTHPRCIGKTWPHRALSLGPRVLLLLQLLTPSLLPPLHPDSIWWLSVILQTVSCPSEIKVGVLTKCGGGRCKTQEDVGGSGRRAERQPGWARMPRRGGVGQGKMTVGARMTWLSLDRHHATPSSVSTLMDEGHQAHPETLTLHPRLIPSISPSPALSSGQRAPHRMGEDWTPRGAGHDSARAPSSCARARMLIRPT